MRQGRVLTFLAGYLIQIGLCSTYAAAQA